MRQRENKKCFRISLHLGAARGQPQRARKKWGGGGGITMEKASLPVTSAFSPILHSAVRNREGEWTSCIPKPLAPGSLGPQGQSLYHQITESQEENG